MVSGMNKSINQSSHRYMETAYPARFSSIYPPQRLLLLLTYSSRMEQSFPLDQRASTSFDSALSTQQRPPIALPSPPPPDATPRQVRQFFKQCFLANRTELSERQAEEEATLLSVKLRLTGNSLYMLSKETLIATFGAEGEVIYNIVQSGKFGYVSLQYHL